MDIRKVEVVDYNSQWKLMYQLEEKSLAQTLGNLAMEIHHIGSTSVEGLCAKPIIDILVVVADLVQLDLKTTAMKKLGYLVKGEFGIKGRRYFRKSVV